MIRKKLAFKGFSARICASALFVAAYSVSPALSQQDRIIHDAEYYVLEAQNGDKWAKEDIGLDKKLAELRKKHAGVEFGLGTSE